MPHFNSDPLVQPDNLAEFPDGSVGYLGPLGAHFPLSEVQSADVDAIEAGQKLTHSEAVKEWHAAHAGSAAVQLSL